MTEGSRDTGVAKPITPNSGPEIPEASHAKVKGRARRRVQAPWGRLGVVEASTGSTTHRTRRGTEGGSRAASAMSIGVPDPLPLRPPGCSVCETHDPTGEPSAGKPHARFGERGEETRPRGGLRHRPTAKAAGNSYSLPLPLARLSSTLPKNCRPGLHDTGPFILGERFLDSYSGQLSQNKRGLKYLDRGLVIAFGGSPTIKGKAEAEAQQSPSRLEEDNTLAPVSECQDRERSRLDGSRH